MAFVINSLIIFIFFLFFPNIINQESILPNCPNEINENYYYIGLIPSGDFIRFSQCFYCINYIGGKICILNNKIYEFYNSCNNIYDLSSNLTGTYYNLLLIEKETFELTKYNVHYLIYFIGYNKHINLLYYLFSSETNKNEYIKERKINSIEIEDPKSLTCQVNKNENELICFYIYRPYLFVEIFDINRNFETIYKNNITFNFQDNNNITLKSSITSNAKKILLVWEQIGNSAFYNYFICKERIFKTSISLDGCESTKQLMEIYYDNPNNLYSSKLIFLGDYIY